jgi:2-polyprenyl-6-methoxyphenol hydroxylase-like FAD-dependent oxidoreductase
MRTLIVGAGICGLGTALLLARDGHDVTVLERDDDPLPATPQDAWEAWSRKGVAQFRQPHNLMPGLRLILEAELPDVQEALRRAGAERFDLVNPLPPPLADRGPRAIDDKLWTYTARRPVAEWVFAEAAAREPRIRLRRGVQATELLAGPAAAGAAPHVVGVRTSEGEDLGADLVVDAMGRASRGPKWLAAIGARPVHEQQEDCGFTYYTRYYRGRLPTRMASPLTPLGTFTALTLPGDNGTWSVTMFAASDDKPLRALRDPAKFTQVVGACPLHSHWLAGEPITDVLSMSGPVDRYRRFVVDGRPVATGFVAVADAWACTNPSAGRGITVGMAHALRLRDVLREEGDDPRTLVERFDAVTEQEIAPWYHAQIALDRMRFAQMEALREGLDPRPPESELARQCVGLFATMTADADLFRAVLEYAGTLTPIQTILRRTGVAERIAAAARTLRDSTPPPIPAPTRAELLELVS